MDLQRGYTSYSDSYSLQYGQRKPLLRESVSKNYSENKFANSLSELEGTLYMLVNVVKKILPKHKK